MHDDIKAALPQFVGHTLLLLFLVLIGWQLTRHYYQGEYGYDSLKALNAQLVAQNQKNAQQAQALSRLRADVADLKSGLVAIEEHARLDLGFIKSDEVFVQLSSISQIEDGAPVPQNEPDAPEVLDAMDNIPWSDVAEAP